MDSARNQTADNPAPINQTAGSFLDNTSTAASSNVSPYQAFISTDLPADSYENVPPPPDNSAPAPQTVVTAPPPSKKSPFGLIFLILIFAIFALGGAVFLLNVNKTRQAAIQPAITPPVTYSPTEAAKVNPFNSPTPVYENPFISPTPFYKNPFGEYENPFANASKTADLENAPYQNPFTDLK